MVGGRHARGGDPEARAQRREHCSARGITPVRSRAQRRPVDGRDEQPAEDEREQNESRAEYR
jgi:hypothetical protein